MGNQTVAINQLNVSLRVRILDDTDGTPATGVVAATTGQEIWYQRGPNTAIVTDGGSAADLAGITTAHTDWRFIHIREGWYRVDLPDAAFIEGVGSVICGINATGFTGISVTVDISAILKFQGSPDSVTSTTTTFPTGTTPLKGDTIMVVDGTGEPGNTVLVTSVAGEVATHAEFETGISATNTTIVLIAGDAVLADGGINVDAAITTRATPAQVNTEVDTALVDIHLDHLLGVDYDPSAIPGVSGALLNELVEGDGVAEVRFTSKAISQAPVSGADFISMPYAWSTGTTAVNPTTGAVRVNNATYASVTAIYINYEAANASHMGEALSRVTSGDTITISQRDTVGRFLRLDVSGAVTDNTGWYTIPVTVADSGSSIGANEVTEVSIGYVGSTAAAVSDAVWDKVLDSNFVISESAAEKLKLITGVDGSTLETNALGSNELAVSAVNEIWQTVLTEGYATLGGQGTASQILYTIQQFLTDADLSGTTMTIRQRNGTSAAYVIELDSATTPTDKNRTS